MRMRYKRGQRPFPLPSLFYTIFKDSNDKHNCEADTILAGKRSTALKRLALKKEGTET